MGLVNRAVAPGDALKEAQKMAVIIASKAPAVLKIGKRAFYDQLERSLADAYVEASRVMVDNMLARDAEEGIAAFIEKRDPVWSS